MGAGPPPPAGHQPLCRVHQPGLPGPVRSGLHLRRRDRQPGHRPGERARHHRDGLRQGLGAGVAAPGPHRQERGGHRFGPGGPGSGRLPEQAGPCRHRLRAGGPPRRPFDVRHPQHEAGKAGHRAPDQDHAGRGGRVPHRDGRGPDGGRRRSAGPPRRRGPVLRGQAAPRPGRPRPGRRRGLLCGGLPDQRHPQPAGFGLCGRARPLGGRQKRPGHRGRRHRQRLPGHRPAAGLRRPDGPGNDARASRLPRRVEPLARVAPGAQGGLRPGGKLGPPGQGPAGLPDHRQGVPQGRGRAAHRRGGVLPAP